MREQSYIDIAYFRYGNSFTCCLQTAATALRRPQKAKLAPSQNCPSFRNDQRLGEPNPQKVPLGRPQCPDLEKLLDPPADPMSSNSLS